MRTEQLMAALVADAPVRSGSARGCANRVMPPALGLVLLFFAMFLGIRPDLASGSVWPAVAVKVLAGLLLAGLGIRLALILAEPGRTRRRLSRALFAVPAILLLALGVELARMGIAGWQDRLIGANQLRCLVLIPLLSLLPLTGLLFALSRGAVTRPGLAGFVSGLTSAGVGAALYSLNCTDDSMLFVLTWYTLAALIVAAAGGSMGRLLLRW